jgi:TRAP-type C4-dicarboxylate transport system permease small subunit
VTDHSHSRARERLLSFLQHLRNWEIRVAALALLAMMMVTCVDVFMRYAFNNPVRGSYDFVESMLVVVVFHGIAAGFLSRTNIVIDLFDMFAPKKIIGPCIRVSDVLTVAALVLLTAAMITPFTQAWEYGDTKIDLGLPLYILWIAGLGGMLISIACALGATFLEDPKPNEGPAA